jgi:alpha-beta hydrolase superfamily lysophospholipase
MVRERSTSSRVVAATAIALGAAAFAGVVGLGALTVYVARRVVTPSKTRVEDLRILGSTETTITLSKTLDTLLPGHYGLWFSEGAGHARVGAILEVGPRFVMRELIGVDHGDLATAVRGSIAGWFFLEPSELDYPFEDVDIETTLGPAPAWLIPSARHNKRWMIGVHGRGVRRQECLRAVAVARECGYTSLLVSYRNDGDAPHGSDGLYGLGDTEWVDVDAAVSYAISHGATEIVLMGWSMGGAISLQVVTRSANAGVIKGIILESPVVNWIDTINYQTDALKVPRFVSVGAQKVVSAPWGRALTGQDTPIDLQRLNFVARADELEVPILILHSTDDGYVPASASRELALARPDIVTFDEFTIARHAKLWNYDPERFETDIRSWLKRLR